MDINTAPKPARRRFVARARRGARLLGFVRGPVWFLIAVAAVLTAAGRLALAWGLEVELLWLLAAGSTTFSRAAALRRWALWLRNRWRTHGPGSGDTESPGEGA
jgi:hypothetical protein